jgi:hypothetical protein
MIKVSPSSTAVGNATLPETSIGFPPGWIASASRIQRGQPAESMAKTEAVAPIAPDDISRVNGGSRWR